MMSPTHPKTRTYFQRGLFDGLTSFRELEGRISGLATKGERGDAFEIFAEAYLATVAVRKRSTFGLERASRIRCASDWP